MYSAVGESSEVCLVLMALGGVARGWTLNEALRDPPFAKQTFTHPSTPLTYYLQFYLKINKYIYIYILKCIIANASHNIILISEFMRGNEQ